MPEIESREPRILIYDIETSLQAVAVFQLGDNNWIQPSNILQERHMLSACWMWLGENTVHSVSLLDDMDRYEVDPHDDYHVVKTLRDVMAQADVLVAHWGDNFDRKYEMTRILVHNLEPLPPIQSIDTKKIAKQFFYFNANSLEYLVKALDCKHKKLKTTPGLWLAILKGGPKAIEALKQMVHYNKGDVLAERDLLMKFMPYIPNYINRQLFNTSEGCPRCGSHKIQSRGTYYAQTRTYRRWQCRGTCKGWFKTLKADKNSATKYRVL